MIEEIRYTNKADAMAAVSNDGYALEYASEALKADREVVMAAIENIGYALQYASEELRSDSQFILAAVEKNGYALKYASDVLKADPEVVLAAVTQNGKALFDADEALRADRGIVMAAIKECGIAFFYADFFVSQKIKADRDFILEVVKKDGYILSHASEALRADKTVVLEAMKQSISCMEYGNLVQEDMLWALDFLPAKAAIENQEEAGSRILGCVGMFVDQMRRDCGSLKKDYESTDISFEDYYEHIISYISVRDIGLLSQLSTNRYVEDESETGEVIIRSPRRKNEHKNDDGMTIASITKEDREKGVKGFVNGDDYPDALRRLNYGR